MSLQDLLEVVPSGSEEQALVRAIDFERLPRHVAIIMDGNGRWAKLRHKRRVEGHRAGIASVRDVVETSARLGLQVLTLYAFSVENWKRPQTERSEEHTSELQSRQYLVCRLLLEKKKTTTTAKT